MAGFQTWKTLGHRSVTVSGWAEDGKTIYRQGVGIRWSAGGRWEFRNVGGGGSSFVLCFAPILFQPVFMEVKHIPFQELLLTPSSKLSLFQCVCCFNTAMQESCLPVAHVHIPVYLQQCLPQPPPLSLLHARRIIRQYEGAQSCLLLTSVSSYCYYVYPWPLHHVSKFASSLKKEKSTNVLCRTRLRISSPLFFFFLVSHFVNHSNCS